MQNFSGRWNDGWARSLDREMDFIVIMSEDLKMFRIGLGSTKKANSMLDIINRRVLYKSAEVSDIIAY